MKQFKKRKARLIRVIIVKLKENQNNNHLKYRKLASKAKRKMKFS